MITFSIDMARQDIIEEHNLLDIEGADKRLNHYCHYTFTIPSLGRLWGQKGMQNAWLITDWDRLRVFGRNFFDKTFYSRHERMLLLLEGVMKEWATGDIWVHFWGIMHEAARCEGDITKIYIESLKKICDMIKGFISKYPNEEYVITADHGLSLTPPRRELGVDTLHIPYLTYPGNGKIIEEFTNHDGDTGWERSPCFMGRDKFEIDRNGVVYAVNKS